MKTGRVTTWILTVLGFGGAVGMTAGCGAGRAHKSRAAEVAAADTELRVMYGVPRADFDTKRTAVAGTVTDANDGTPLVGVVVERVGHKAAVLTDADGKYFLRDVAEGDTLRFSYLGYRYQLHKFTDGMLLNVRLNRQGEGGTLIGEEPLKVFDEVIMVMYGVRPAVFDPDKPVDRTDGNERHD